MKSLVLFSLLASFSLCTQAQIVSGRHDMGQGEKYDIAHTEVMKHIIGKSDYVGKRWWWYAIVTPVFPLIAFGYQDQDGQFYGTARSMSSVQEKKEAVKLQEHCKKFLEHNVKDGIPEMVDGITGLMDKDLFFYSCSPMIKTVITHEDGVAKRHIYSVEVRMHSLKLH